MYQNLRTIIFILGCFLLLLAIIMIIPMAVNLLTHNEWHNFAVSCIITFLCGIVFILCGKLSASKNICVFVITSSIWIAISIFSAFPFVFSSDGISYIDGLFEATSGITTTGATLLVKLHEKSPGLLLWRAILHFMGGLGIIVVGIIIFPLLKVVNLYSLYHSESSDNSDKFLSDTTSISLFICLTYCFFTIICTILYYIAGMSFFDSICHAMSTVSTGGFANYDDSFRHFNNVFIEIIAELFMLLGSCPFLLYLRVIYKHIFYDEQVTCFLKLIILATLLSVIIIYVGNVNFKTQSFSNEILSSLRYGLFTIISLITSTGFINFDYSNFTTICILTLFLTFIGGCTGSTNSGIKVYRVILLAKSIRKYLNHILQPHRIITVSFNRKIVDDNTIAVVHMFFFLYISIFTLSCIMVSLSGVDFVTSFSMVSSTLTNAGPGIGEVVGPSGNYSSLLSWVKLLLSFLMIIGRLEMIPIFVLMFSIFNRSY